MPESQPEFDHLVQVSTCYSLDCSDCGSATWDDEGKPHWPSMGALWEELTGPTGYGWTSEHGRPLCDQCSKAADCERDGHQWNPWRPHPTGLLPEEWRTCDHCTNGWERRPVEMTSPPEGSAS